MFLEEPFFSHFNLQNPLELLVVLYCNMVKLRTLSTNKNEYLEVFHYPRPVDWMDNDMRWVHISNFQQKSGTFWESKEKGMRKTLENLFCVVPVLDITRPKYLGASQFKVLKKSLRLAIKRTSESIDGLLAVRNLT